MTEGFDMIYRVRTLSIELSDNTISMIEKEPWDCSQPIGLDVYQL